MYNVTAAARYMELPFTSVSVLTFSRIRPALSLSLSLSLFHSRSRSRSCGRQADKRTLVNRTSQRQPLRPRPIVSALDTLELLHQSDGRVASFRKCELFCFKSASPSQNTEGKCIRTTDADSRAAVKRQIFPSRPQSLPSLRPELFGILAVEVLPAVHAVE